jgi:hypothetical protein
MINKKNYAQSLLASSSSKTNSTILGIDGKSINKTNQIVEYITL